VPLLKLERLNPKPGWLILPEITKNVETCGPDFNHSYREGEMEHYLKRKKWPRETSCFQRVQQLMHKGTKIPKEKI